MLARRKNLRSEILGATLRWFAVVSLAAAMLLVTRESCAVAVTVEITDDAQALVDAQLARRLIRLELADVELPKVNGAAPTNRGETVHGHEEVVFVRLLSQQDTLVVELWAQGALSGERRLSVSPNQQHQARRVALASAELARRVREARVVERHRYLRKHLAPKPNDAAPEYVTKVRVEGAAAIAAVMWPDADALLVGPRLFLDAVTDVGIGLGITAAAFTTTGSATVSSFSELALRPSWQAILGPHLQTSVGLSLGLGQLDVAPSASFASSDVSRQTWQTKVALDAQLRWVLSPRLSLFAAPEAALLTRTVEVSLAEQSEKLGGTWFGIALGALVYL